MRPFQPNGYYCIGQEKEYLEHCLRLWSLYCFMNNRLYKKSYNVYNLSIKQLKQLCDYLQIDTSCDRDELISKLDHHQFTDDQLLLADIFQF